jgi:ABC-2 type transport system permease protein
MLPFFHFKNHSGEKETAGKTRRENMRALKSGGYSLIAGAIVIAIAVAANLCVNALPAKYTKKDMTQNGLYTLSDQTRQILKSLKQDVTVYWVSSVSGENDSISHLLDTYTSESSHIKAEKIDPLVYPNFLSQYTTEKASDNSLVVVSGEKNRYIPDTDIKTVDYASYYTTGNASQQFDGENALTSAISYVTSDSMPVLYTLTGHGEDALDDALKKSVTKENYTVKELNLLTSEKLPDDAGCLLINNPQKDLSADEEAKILTYLKKGGKLMLITENTSTTFANLNALMKNYGVSPVPGIVIEQDPNHTMQGYNYVLLPAIANHDITKAMNGSNYYVLVPGANGIAKDEKLPDGVKVTDLLTTSAKSYSKKEGYNITTYEKEAGDTDGPFAVGTAISAAVSGSDAGADSTGAAASGNEAASSESTASGENAAAKTETRIVWYTSAKMFTDQYNQAVSGTNFDLFLNSLDWMTEKTNSISIRAKDLTSAKLTVPSSAISMWGIILIGLIPFGLLLIGILTTLRRRRL